MTAKEEEELRYEPRNYGKSFKVWQQFIAYSRAGEAIVYRTPEGDICSPAQVKRLLDTQKAALTQQHEREKLEAQYRGALDFSRWIIQHDQSNFRQERAWFKIKPQLILDYQAELEEKLQQQSNGGAGDGKV